MCTVNRLTPGGRPPYGAERSYQWSKGPAVAAGAAERDPGESRVGARDVVQTEDRIVVAGAGPVGLTAATALADAGFQVLVVEAAPAPETDWRASTFHAATMELLEELEVAERMLDEGLAVPRYQFRDRQQGLVAEFDCGLLADETAYPFRLQLNQQRLVAMLHDRVAALDTVEVRFATRVADARDEGDQVVVTLDGPDGPHEERGAVLIGADGARSTVRERLGVSFEGFTYPQQFQIVSTSADLAALLPGIAEVNYVADPDEWLFLLRTPESWRVVWPADEPITDPAELDAQLQRVAPNPAGYEILDQQVYRVHQRVAGAFRRGRIALVGDAAHINSPVGGVGLNSGIHDAFDLVRRLVRVRDGGGDLETELTTFDEVRRRVAVEYVQADTERNTRRLAERDPAVRERTLQEMRDLAADPERTRAWLRRVTLLESVRRFGVGRPAGTPAAASA
ncbi:FAD-dependent monooxygenase [Nitriliruptoraceae bacterium ZYF776]|nr:FAD-dependent monooxygenase [Profundirhabdus halotolerans]